MTDTMPPVPAIGQLDWGDDIQACLTWLSDHVVTLESQPNGAVMSFTFSDAPTARAVSIPPGTLSFDTADQEAASYLYASTTTMSGADASLALASPPPGTVLVLQQSGAVNQYAMATVAGDPIDQGGFFQIPVSRVKLASAPLRPGLTGLSAAGISGGSAPAGYEQLQQQVAINSAAISDLQARVAALESGGVEPPADALVYLATASNNPPSGPGVICFLGDQTNANPIWMSLHADNGDNTALILAQASGCVMRLEDQNDPSRWQEYMLVEAPVGQGVYATMNNPVHWNSGAQLVLTATVVVTFSPAAPPTPTGPGYTAMTPTSGPVSGGTTVTVTGSGFRTFGAYDVAVYDDASNYWGSSNFAVVNDTTITFTTPGVDHAGAGGLVITFNTADNIDVPNAFTYL